MKCYWPLLLAGILLVGCADQDKLNQLEAEQVQLKTKLAEYEPRDPDSLAYKVAVISAGHPLSPGDASIQQSKTLLPLLAKQYGTSEEEISRMAVYFIGELNKQNVSVNLLSVLEAATIYGAADKSQWPELEKGFSAFLAMYAGNRKDGFMTHEQASRGLLGVQISLINLGGHLKGNIKK
ncbi:MAG: hypothetical protein NT086_02020 [Proteobacteria bacterium]|nr:hypothetical protein [Pseudomonadota bacterium]